MVELFQAALAHHGVEDTVLAVGQFEPRGVSGSMFAGAMIGDEVGGSVGLGGGSRREGCRQDGERAAVTGDGRRDADEGLRPGRP